MKKIHFNKKWSNIIIDLLIIIFVITLGISIYKICLYKIHENDTKEELEVINEDTDVDEVTDTDDTEVIEQDDSNKTGPYWDYIKMNLIDVDFEELKKQNSDVRGWIQVNGTNINYPFVQSTDNEFYLTHSFNKAYNFAGWVFLDYRNDISNFDNKNTILYAHAMKNRTMFGSLKNILSSGWLNDTDNYVIKLSTEYENTLWQVFSVYHIPITTDYLQTEFESDDEFQSFANMLIKRSSHNFNTTITSSDRIITLSTCYTKTDRVVLHAKLIKRETK